MAPQRMIMGYPTECSFIIKKKKKVLPSLQKSSASALLIYAEALIYAVKALSLH